ncbi:MAG TPA: hypothetical protein PLW24_17605 [Burkholderiaceae bacterium]|nr:hypothetical protein [Burkholderiaceae bacterium]HNB45336.1 hypothetical protein [Burkholderiaceae bacterium]HNG81295.1 hypothetical protein [Burkholderiaceae bacterium]
MSRKRCRRVPIQPQPPAGLRRMLTRDQITDLAIAHLQNLDAVASGQGTEDTLWDIVECTLLWSRVADQLHAGVDEMRAQLELSTRLVERFGSTGRVGFSGVEYQAAKVGIEVMDELARIVDQPTASAACDWAEAQVMRLSLEAGQRQADADAAGRCPRTADLFAGPARAGT